MLLWKVMPIIEVIEPTVNNNVQQTLGLKKHLSSTFQKNLYFAGSELKFF